MNEYRGFNIFVPERVKIQRKQQGLSMVDFAEKVGVTKLTVFNWEHGLYEPNHINMPKLCEATDKHPSYYYN